MTDYENLLIPLTVNIIAPPILSLLHQTYHYFTKLMSTAAYETTVQTGAVYMSVSFLKNSVTVNAFIEPLQECSLLVNHC